MKQVLVLLAVMAALLAVVACSPTGGQEPIAVEPTEATEPTTGEEPAIMEENALQGVRWVLVSYLNAAGETVTALADAKRRPSSAPTAR